VPRHVHVGVVDNKAELVDLQLHLLEHGLYLNESVPQKISSMIMDVASMQVPRSRL
jgi:hypothetical protein